MKNSSNKSLSHLNLTQLILFLLPFACLLVFFQSFFHLSQTSPPSTKTTDHHAAATDFIQSQPPFSKMVFIVIDALRFDLFFSPASCCSAASSSVGHVVETGNCYRMPFTQSKVKNGVNAFIAHAHPPTVTLPRLKSMMSGQMPHFLDVVFNLVPMKTKTINRKKKKSRIGVGLKHATSENEDMDDNHVEDDHTLLYKLKMDKKWRMVLLGDETWTRVSPLAASGLYFETEMSETTNSLFVTDTVQVDLNVTRNLPRLLTRSADWDLLVMHYLGLDHIGHVYGISDLSSSILNAKLEEMDKVVQQVYEYVESNDPDTLIVVCSDHGMTNTGNHGGASPAETDATLLFLSPRFAVRSESVHTSNDQLPPKINQVDMVPTLSSLLGVSTPSKSVGQLITPLLDTIYDEETVLQMLRNNYNQLLELSNKPMDKMPNISSRTELLSAIQIMSKSLIEQKSSSDEVGMMIALIGLAITCIALLRFRLWENDLTFIPSLSRISMILLSSLILVHVVDVIMEFDYVSITLPHYVIVCSLLILYEAVRFQPNEKSTHQGAGVMKVLCVLVFVIHTLSLSSSSFIEEEHNLWYFSCTTIFVMFLLLSVMNRERKLAICVTLALVTHRVACHWHQSGIKYQDNQDTIATNLARHISSETSVSLYLLACCLYVPLICCLIVRFQSRLCVGSTFTQFLLVTTATSVFLFKTAIGMVPSIELVYGMVIGSIVLHFFELKRKQTTWDIVPLLISITQLWICIEKIENCMLVVLFSVQVFCLIKALEHYSRRMEPWEACFICYMVSMSGFYYFGRNISISSVDFSTAYQGLTEYRPNLIGAIVFLQIYLPRLLPLVLVPLAVNRKKWNSSFNIAVVSTLFFVLTFQLLMNSGMLFAMKAHLFIWSVFSPKYLWVVGDWLCMIILTAIQLIAIRTYNNKEELLDRNTKHA